ncbi:HNH endonuclease [Corynebacterium guaraldiae]|uniref:HNH endonuclease n=1 Tax=Corynebacterium guaraldiae TaxID=3051103 RepID=UPI001E519184|nr:HNH endonuclease [Corynebacterium guaraldiae]
MNALQTFLNALGAGIDVIAECEGMSEADLIAAGSPDKTAAQLVRLHTSFFGKTTMTKMQRDAVKAARQRGHSLPTLEVIDRYARKAKTQALGWKLRLELCRTSADTLAMETLAKKKLKEHSAPPAPKEGVTIYRRRNAPWTMAITGPAQMIAELSDAVDRERPPESIREAFFKGAAPRRGLQTNILVPLDAMTKILNGDGEEITLQMTNGATMTGAEYLNKVLAEEINLDGALATLFHPYHGPVNLYYEERSASIKQRIMPWPSSRSVLGAPA